MSEHKLIYTVMSEFYRDAMEAAGVKVTDERLTQLCEGEADLIPADKCRALDNAIYKLLKQPNALLADQRVAVIKMQDLLYRRTM